MKRTVSVTLAVALVLGLTGFALAQGPGYGMMRWGAGIGPGAMGGWGAGAGPGACPMFGAGGGPAAAAQAQITEEKAKALATEYADKYFKGYSVERVLPFERGFRTMYQAELKGPKGESRILHITPWGGVRPFGGVLVEG
jgi:hypothetical protein